MLPESSCPLHAGDGVTHTALAACKKLGDDATVCEAAARGKMYRLEKPTLHLYTDP